MTINALRLPPRSPARQPSALLTGAILPTIARLSLPNMLAMLATTLVAIAETWYVGKFGTSALAGLTFVFPMVMLQQMMSGGAMGSGVSSAISRALGAGDDARASALALHAVVIGACVGLLFTWLLLAYGHKVYQLLGGHGEALAQALTYSNIVFVGVAGVWLCNTAASIIRGSGNMAVPSATLLFVAVTQVAIGGVFGLGWLGVPSLGMAGVALGTVIAYGLGAVFMLFYLLSGRGRVALRLRGATLKWGLFRDILKVGGLACISPIQSVLTVLVITRLVSTFGTEALAGYGIGARLEFLLIPIAFAIGTSCVPMVGMALGAGQASRARRVAWSGGLLAAACVGLVGVLAAIWPDVWTTLFTTDAAVIASARSYFRWTGPWYELYGLGLCLYFASLGAGQVVGPVLAGTVRLVIALVGGWWLASIGAPAWMFFALIGGAMAAYGLATALSVYLVPWGKLQKAA